MSDLLEYLKKSYITWPNVAVNCPAYGKVGNPQQQILISIV